MELMETPTWHRLNNITKDLPWREDLASLRDELLAKGLTDDIPADRAFWDQAELTRNQRQRCGEPDARGGPSISLARRTTTSRGQAGLSCETFLNGSEKAEQQSKLEKRFQVFEAGF
jgi:hypothetical protein